MAATVLEREGLLASAVEARRMSREVWSTTPLARRLEVLRQARYVLARRSEELVDAISPRLARTRADSYAAEVLPLLAACKFLEDQATDLLAPRRLGRRGLPFWLAGVDNTVERVPLGTVLVIAPSNYPLLLPGVQVLQALAAGNAVAWKPGSGGREVAEVMRAALLEAGLPANVLRVTEDTTEAAVAALDAGADKIVFTGSSVAGKSVLRRAAETATPVVAELSGCDAVIALESADVERLVAAMVFGMRFNGSATCMAPRRLFLVGAGHEQLIARLQERFAACEGVEVSGQTARQLRELLAEAEHEGATVCGNVGAATLKPVLVTGVNPAMRLAQADVFAPVLMVMEAPDLDEVVAAQRLCPFGLTAAIFGDERTAQTLAARLDVGTVLINDVIVPTADPRVPFGGRRGSGFGVTRGAEGLLEMTAVKVVAARRGGSTRHYQETNSAHESLFRGAVEMSHSATWRERFAGLRRMMAAAKRLK